MLFSTDSLVVIAAIVLLGPAITLLTVALHFGLARAIPTTWVRLSGAMTVSIVAVFWAYGQVLDRFA